MKPEHDLYKVHVEGSMAGLDVRALTGVELEADEQNLRHDKANGLEGLRCQHEDQAKHAHVDLAKGRHRSPQRYEHHCYYQAAAGVF